jgi:hypothetical protein
MSANKASVTRRRNLAVERANRAYIPQDEYAAQASAQRAYRKAFEHGADMSPINRIALQCAMNGTLDTFGIEHVREILERTVHTRSLVVKQRVTDHVVKAQRANSAPCATQNKVSAAKEFAANAAHSLHELRKRIDELTQAHSVATGAERKVLRKRLLTNVAKLRKAGV